MVTRNKFAKKGGKMHQNVPHYMVVEFGLFGATKRLKSI